MNKILKNKKILTSALIIVAIVFLAAISLQSGFAATTHNINNTTSGGINGTLATATHGDTIELDEGTYTDNNNTNMTINKNITIQGKTKDKVIIDAQGLSRIFTIGNNLNVIFINITFTNAYAESNGGAIMNNNGRTTMIFINCTFSNNKAINGGGIISYGNVTIRDSTFTNNSVVDRGAGGFIISGVNGSVNVGVYDSIFMNNSAADHGGGVLITSGTNASANVDIYNSTFTNNLALNGGGVLITSGVNGSVNVGVYDSIFMSNNVNHTGGGMAILSSQNGSVNVGVYDSIFMNNSAVDNGGGVLITSGINATINVDIYNSTFTNNSALSGGGIFINSRIVSTTNVNIYDSTMNDNSATDNGGGICVYSIEDAITNVNIYDSTMSGNFAGNSGGGISSITGVNSTGDCTVNVYDSDIANNTAGNKGGALSAITGVNSSGDSTINVFDSGIFNNSAGNNGDSISTTTGDGSTGNSEVNVGGDSTITNNNPNRDDEGLFSSTGDNSTGESNINIASSVTITRLSANSTIVAPNATVGKPTTIRGVAKDQNNKPLANIKLTVTMDGKIYTVTTNSAGEWSLNYIPIKIANIQVTVALNQNNVYYAFSKIASFRAIQTVTLTISAPTINQGKKTNIKVTLKDANGNILKNKKVSITINKKTYTATTNNNGIAIFNIAGLKGGKYTVIAKFAGDNDYKSLTVSGIQKVNSKVNLGILSIKKIKSSNKKNPKYKITIINKGSLKSKATVLAIFHIRNGLKIKTKYFKIKAIAAGKKISIIVDYFPDIAKHRYCIAHYTLDPKNKNKEILLSNNKKSISLKH